MAAPTQSASPLFLREPEIRRGIELLYFGYSHMTRSIDRGFAAQGLGRAHHRALYFIARQPDPTVSHLLALLAIAKQSPGRVPNDLGLGTASFRARVCTYVETPVFCRSLKKKTERSNVVCT